ncbi:hypothetical protein [uncultured Intestinimonas sp.]|uniref:hypothetical protein n=1 Tax=uncultured Intestinimonas sp. TaxID=1689265 RepID=UPI0025D42316|nr:hypothetical protein [uncultured Intestinimonas sp.]
MGKIFGYECRRLLWNKFFVGLLLVLLFYGWQVLTGATLLGVAHTAPFSPWSFGDYLGQMTPLLWIGALFFLTFFTSGKARRAAVLTDATQADPRRYALARSAAALAGTALLALACLGEAAVFYGACFDWYGWGELALPALAALVPPLVFALGSGWLLGQVRPWLVYAWMPLPLLVRALPLPEALGLWDGSLFAEYPLTLGAWTRPSPCRRPLSWPRGPCWRPAPGSCCSAAGRPGGPEGFSRRKRGILRGKCGRERRPEKGGRHGAGLHIRGRAEKGPRPGRGLCGNSL